VLIPQLLAEEPHLYCFVAHSHDAVSIAAVDRCASGTAGMSGAVAAVLCTACLSRCSLLLLFLAFHPFEKTTKH
jgi:hypothetical protein